MLWSGTVAENLDPTKEVSEERLLEALSKAAFGGTVFTCSTRLAGSRRRRNAFVRFSQHLGFMLDSVCVMVPPRCSPHASVFLISEWFLQVHFDAKLDGLGGLAARVERQKGAEPRLIRETPTPLHTPQHGSCWNPGVSYHCHCDSLSAGMRHECMLDGILCWEPIGVEATSAWDNDSCGSAQVKSIGNSISFPFHVSHVLT